MNALFLNTAPTSEPVSAQEAREHLRLDDAQDIDDGIVAALISAAREDCERFQNRSYFSTTWELWLDDFPGGDVIKLLRPPLQSVTSIKYYDTSDTEATFSSGSYFVDVKSEPGRVVLNYGQSWPSTSLRPANGVCITYVAGYAAKASIPANWRAAILLLLGHLYENREAVIIGVNAQEMPLGVVSLLTKDRIFE